jgi:hypothetical protein
MSDEKITDRVLDGGEYERAKVTVRQTFSIPLRTKIRAAIGSLLTTVPLGPAVVLRTDVVESYEGTLTFELIIGQLALLGILTVFFAGLLLVRQHYILLADSMTAERARKLVRTEDLLMWFVLLGAVFGLIATALALVPLVSSGAVDSLYDAGVRVYRPTNALGVDVRLVSALGAVFSLVLFALRVWVDSDS